MNSVIGLDIGYGYTKAVSNTGIVTLHSVIGPAVTIKYHDDLTSNGRGLTLEADGKAWFIGQHARLQSPFTISPRARERDPEVVRLLALAALCQVNANGDTVRMVTGLPVEWYADRDKLIRSLTGFHAFATNGQRQTIHIAGVLVVPQPFGSLFRALLTPAGVLADPDGLAGGRVAVLDIGMHTTDYALADALRYVEPRSGSIPVAMARVYELVRRGVTERHSLTLSLHDAEDAARAGYVTIYGRREPVADLVAGALAGVAQEILGEAVTLWGDGRDLLAVLVTGGGGPALLERVRTIYPHARLVANPQTANAEGFYRYALRKFGEMRP
jgi:plasmid segregation protein ParM